MAKSAPAFSGYGCQVAYAMAIPVVPAGSYPGSTPQKERAKRHTTNNSTRTIYNENTETITQMA